MILMLVWGMLQDNRLLETPAWQLNIRRFEQKGIEDYVTASTVEGMARLSLVSGGGARLSSYI